MELDVLGPVRVRRDGDLVDLGTPRQRAIVAALALGEGRVVPVDTVVDRVWGDDAPPTVMGTLQSYVGGLRRSLEPDRRPREPARLLVTEHDGYALRVPLSARDDVRLAEATARARALLQVVPDPLRPRTDAEGSLACREAIAVVDAALASWRGTPYADLGDHAAAVAERSRLADLRAAAEELRVVARLALGEHGEVVAGLEALTRQHPMHERWWALYAVALVREGRQADALAALQRLRSVLDDELGVEPSAAVRELQTAILRQDPSVAWTDPGASAPEEEPAPVDRRAPRREHERRRFRASPPLPQWELSGRDAELARLRQALDHAAAGRARAVWVAGEAGIGKSRLVHELALEAFARGFTVAQAACGQVGAPALWPWQQVFASVAEQRVPWPVDPGPWFAVGAAEEFATWDGVSRAVRDAARSGPLCVVLEDLHDADAPTLALLRHLVTTATDEPLLVVATRRTGAGDDELLVPLAAAVARAGGVRLDLGGLDGPGARGLVESVTGHRPGVEEADALRDRTAGNAFFLVELALAGGGTSGSLTDVVASRLADLPVATRAVLDAASVVGDRWDEDVVAHVVGTTPDALAEALAPALAAGVVVEADPVERVHRFGHAVVRDVVRDGLPAVDRNRLHARVAEVLELLGGLRRVDQRAEVARQWTLAGKAHAAAGWPAVLRAADRATRDDSHLEAMALVGTARELQDLDVAADDRARYELLMLLGAAQRWAGDWSGVAATVDDAVLVAERMGDAELAARAAMSTIEGAVWQVRTFGVVHRPIVAALERALVRLDADPSPRAVGLRARARVALATELFYDGEHERLDALVDEAVALAEEAGDPRLLSVVLLGAFSARWRSDTLAWRREAAARTVALATEVGDVRSHAVALGVQACAALEAGDAALVRTALPAATVLSRRLGLVTVESVLLAAEVPWRLLEGDDEAAGRALAALQELGAQSDIPNLDRAVGGTVVLAATWQRDEPTLGAVLDSLAAEPEEGLRMGHLAGWVLLRLGRVEEARAVVDPDAIDLREHLYTTIANAALACELGWGLGHRHLAARGYAVLAPYAGRMASGGSAMALGPVDGFLALGAAATGDDAAAEKHAAAAFRLAEEWGLPRYADWFRSAWVGATPAAR